MKVNSAKTRKKARAPLVMFAAGGHAKVCLALAQALGARVVGVCDPALHARRLRSWRGIPVLGGDEAIETIDARRTLAINGIGQLVGSDTRRDLHVRLRTLGLHLATLVHPRAILDPTVRLAEGVQVMAGVIVQSDSVIGEDCIINTGATVDHDCEIGAHVHIAPGATLCGGVRIEDGAFVGANATILPGVTVAAGGVVAAGATLAGDLPSGRLIRGASGSVGKLRSRGDRK